MTASQHYSPQQIAAWAQIDESRWKEKLAKSQVRVAVINAQPVWFYYPHWTLYRYVIC